MTFFGWKKRCRQVEAENARLRERNAVLEARLAEVEAKNLQLVQALAAAAKNWFIPLLSGYKPHRINWLGESLFRNTPLSCKKA